MRAMRNPTIRTLAAERSPFVRNQPGAESRALVVGKASLDDAR